MFTKPITPYLVVSEDLYMKTGNSRLAVNGGNPVRSKGKTWPAWPVHDERERTALLDVLESGKWFFGDRVKAFEAAYADFQGAQHCITCNSGTAAAEIILQAFGIGQGDEVLVPPYTFVATASAVLRVGATPVFVDVDDTWCMDPDLAEAAITPRTRAIMPVHFGGRICDMDKMNDIAEKYGIPVIEDACHCWGGQWKGKGAGTLGACGFFRTLSPQKVKNRVACCPREAKPLAIMKAAIALSRSPENTTIVRSCPAVCFGACTGFSCTASAVPFWTTAVISPAFVSSESRRLPVDFAQASTSLAKPKSVALTVT